MDNASFTADTSEYDEMLLARDEEIAKLEDQIKSLEGSNTVLYDKTQYSEDYKLIRQRIEEKIAMKPDWYRKTK